MKNARQKIANIVAKLDLVSHQRNEYSVKENRRKSSPEKIAEKMKMCKVEKLEHRRSCIGRMETNLDDSNSTTIKRGKPRSGRFLNLSRAQFFGFGSPVADCWLRNRGPISH